MISLALVVKVMEAMESKGDGSGGEGDGGGGEGYLAGLRSENVFSNTGKCDQKPSCALATTWSGANKHCCVTGQPSLKSKGSTFHRSNQ